MRREPPPDLTFEHDLWQGGYARIAGIDEAGRGALAGPVCSAAVVLPQDAGIARTLNGVRDSKQLTSVARALLAPRIQENALAWGVGFASAQEIDTLGILPATRLAALRALEALNFAPDFLLTDYLLFRDIELPQIALVKGDQRSLSVAAASVLAKTSRDEIMQHLDIEHPGYGLTRHKGYGTQAHRAALLRLGESMIHRKTFQLRSGK